MDVECVLKPVETNNGNTEIESNGTPESSNSLTGKRVRKKNPKYNDGTAMKAVDELVKADVKKPGNPKKRKKTTQEESIGDSPSEPSPAALPAHVLAQQTTESLLEQRKSYIRQAREIQEELRKVNTKLYEKQVEYGLPVTVSLTDPITDFDLPTDDEDALPAVTAPPAKKNGVTKRKSGARTPARKAAPKRRGGPGRKKQTTPKVPDPTLPPEFSCCRDVLDQVLRHRHAWPFKQPVDPVALGIPDYFLVIKNPMDLGTIRKKLNTSQYRTTEEFIADVQLVFDNACTYNRPDSDVFLMAEVLKKQFDEKIKTLLHSQSRIQNLKDSVHTIRQEISQILGQKSDASRDVEPATTSSPLPEASPSPVFTKEEKKKLSADISSVPPTQLIQFIKEKLPRLANEKEIVIDIDSLDSESLRLLMEFVETAKKNSSSKRTKPKSTPNKATPPANDTHPPAKESSRHDPTSDSDSDTSESESEESQSESDSEAESRPKKPLQVETVVAPVIANVQSPTPKVAVPEILPTFPTQSKVHDAEITNEVSWSQLSADDDEKSSTPTQSSDAANLWSSYRDSHAQLEQKELEKKQHEKELLQAMEQEERERLEKLKAEEEAERQRWEEEKERKRQEALERQREAEREIEEARQKAKRDRERKVQGDESTDDLLSLDAFAAGGSFPGGMLNVNLSGELMSDLRSSLRGSPTLGTDRPDGVEESK